MPALGRSSLVLPLSVLINRNISSCSCGFFERDRYDCKRARWKKYLGRQLSRVGGGGAAHLLHHLLLLHKHLLDLLHLLVQLIQVHLKKKCGNVQTTSRVATLYHHDPKCMPALSTYFVFNIWDPGTSWFVMRFFTCSPAPWPPPSTIVLVTLFSISENREG